MNAAFGQSRFFLVGIVGALIGCQSGPATAQAERTGAGRSAWVERRAAQLSASGLKASEAAAKASSEWSSLSGEEREGIRLRFSSNDAQRVEQQKVNAGLEKLARGN